MLSEDVPYIQQLRKERQQRKQFPIPEKSDVEKMLIELKKVEPTSNNEFFRLCICSYEFGDLSRAVVYHNRFKSSKKVLFGNGFKSPEAILAEGKLAMADLLTQLNLLCISMHWDFEELRKLGTQHLAERHKDLKRDGWSEVGTGDQR